MKKLAAILAYLLLSLLLLSGCGANTTLTDEKNGEINITEGLSESDTETPEAAEAPTTTEAREEEDISFKKEAISLSDIPLSGLTYTNFEFTDEYLDEFWPDYYSMKSLGYYPVRYESENEICLIRSPVVRDSTKKIAVTDSEKENFISAVSNKYYDEIEYAEKALRLTDTDRIYMQIKNIEKNGVNLTLTVSNARFGYTAKGRFTPNAFVSQGDDGTIRFIIDPAYMIGLPLFGKNPEHYTFDINGTEVMMDSFMCSGIVSTPFEFDDLFEERKNEFFYARLELDNIWVQYDFKTGYSCQATLKGIEPLSDDVMSVMTSSLDDMFDTSEEKPAEMTEAYKAITENFDAVCKDSTQGIILLDLDFDGKAELLVSDRETVEYEDGSIPDQYTNVSVYRIENGELKYIDTFSCDFLTAYRLGAKKLPDGTKGWFTTYGNSGFVYKLVGDKLEAVEVFAGKMGETKTDEDGNIYTDYDYYFMGEKIIPDVVAGNKYFSQTHYEWNGSYSYSEDMWELFAHIKEDYCADITECYYLYSDWLTDNLTDRIALTPREVSYNIAYMVDSYYLGNYNPASRTFEYHFTGGLAKPVIYLYPEEETEVSVKIGFAEEGELTCTYPEYNGGWNVRAFPDGTIRDKDDNEYYCLYWEGEGTALLDGGGGWCVKGSDTAAFLREKLLEIGLTPREANEFIIYWLPEMQNNPYNIITFHTEDYALSVPLEVSPAPDTQIRVFMTFEASEDKVEIPPQKLPHYERNGFTLVEWGGSKK